MALYTMGDLHLSFSTEKPMDIFGEGWANHTDRIRENWPLKENDTIVLAGDLSWGIDLNESDADFAFIDALPGKKILLKGNHDYWWETMHKLEAITARYPSVHFLFNNTYETDSCFICGTRGWIQESATDHDRLIIAREAGRLRLSLEAWRKTGSGKPPVVFLHYPPLFGSLRCDEIWQVLREYDVKRVYYGHLHGIYAHRLAVEGNVDGIEMTLVSADRLRFTPLRIE